LDIKSVIGAILPHAGHIYSGYQTMPFFQLLSKMAIYPDTFVIIHPNHSGFGDPLSLDESEYWRNSLGDVEIDRAFSAHLNIPENRMAHAHEHSGEVIVPFIQYFSPDKPFKIVPVCMLDQSYERATLLAREVFAAAEISGKRIMVIASSDFSHFLPEDKGIIADQFVLDKIIEGDIKGVEQQVRDRSISVCGYGPIMALMAYAEMFSPDYQKQILARGHSGEVSPSNEVVDYISMLFFN